MFAGPGLSDKYLLRWLRAEVRARHALLKYLQHLFAIDPSIFILETVQINLQFLQLNAFVLEGRGP